MTTLRHHYDITMTSLRHHAQTKLPYQGGWRSFLPLKQTAQEWQMPPLVCLHTLPEGGHMLGAVGVRRWNIPVLSPAMCSWQGHTVPRGWQEVLLEPLHPGIWPESQVGEWGRWTDGGRAEAAVTMMREGQGWCHLKQVTDDVMVDSVYSW